MKEYLLEKHQCHPTQNGEMNYCPYCLKEFKKTNKNKSMNFRDVLQPLTYHKYLQVFQDKDGTERKVIEEYWKCDRCKKNLTDKDFVYSYCLRSDGSRYSEPKREVTDDGQQSAITV